MSFELDEPVGIDPRIDVVFHKLFGDPERPTALLDFLNTVLRPAESFETVEVLNPFDPGHYKEHRGLVLDIRARTANGHIVQIEMLRANHAALRARMVYGWARVYSGQLTKSEPYSTLQPAVSIWVCDADPFPEAAQGHVTFELRARDEDIVLHEHCRIDVLRLVAWRKQPESLGNEPASHWFWFFNDAVNWQQVPDAIHSPVMEEAMSTLYEFRRDTQLNELYRGRLEAERLENERLEALEEALLRAAKADQERQRAEQERAQEAAGRQREELEQERAQEAGGGGGGQKPGSKSSRLAWRSWKLDPRRFRRGLHLALGQQPDGGVWSTRLATPTRSRPPLDPLGPRCPPATATRCASTSRRSPRGRSDPPPPTGSPRPRPNGRAPGSPSSIGVEERGEALLDLGRTRLPGLRQPPQSLGHSKRSSTRPPAAGAPGAARAAESRSPLKGAYLTGVRGLFDAAPGRRRGLSVDASSRARRPAGDRRHPVATLMGTRDKDRASR